MDQALKRNRNGESDSQDGLESLSRPISPPLRKKTRQQQASTSITSPWKLTWIQDLPEEDNRDAITLHDILGDPLISECWIFNYLHDINFIMNALDTDVRRLVQVHVVHGFWKREDTNRLALVEDAAAFENVHLHAAHMPEMFGTHHSKIMVLFRHDETAQVIIHTANMIAKDWTNMTNAVWQSPLLPRGSPDGTSPASDRSTRHPLGSGARFKSDFLSYLRAYDKQRRSCKELSDKLKNHDFSDIRAAFIGSVPGAHAVHDLSEPTWGWASLKRCLREVPCTEGESQVVVQISSIATLGAKDDWLQKTLFGALAASKTPKLKRPRFRVVFPTTDEVRRSLDGYASGGSIHTKIQSSQQAKQLQYLRPLFCHWANDSPNGLPLSSTDGPLKDGRRRRAAPHVKTYVRYNSQGKLDWALLTSANLSKQAWGDAERSTGESRIASYEAGVLIWPALFDVDTMVPTFGTDSAHSISKTDDLSLSDSESLVGVRIPYNLPLQSYGPNENPWVATKSHTEPDCLGRTWGV